MKTKMTKKNMWEKEKNRRNKFLIANLPKKSRQMERENQKMFLMRSYNPNFLEEKPFFHLPHLQEHQIMLKNTRKTISNQLRFPQIREIMAKIEVAMTTPILLKTGISETKTAINNSIEISNLIEIGIERGTIGIVKKKDVFTSETFQNTSMMSIN